MRTNKNNKSDLANVVRNRKFLTAFSFALLSFSQFCSSQDLVSGTELKDSSLSLSLTTKVNMTTANEASQLVITQYGIFNQLTVNQASNSDNGISVIQNGANNFANLSQIGSNNEIHLEQLGDNNYAEVIQDGNANVANIIQTGEQTFTVHQIGSDMVVNITQYQY